MTQTGKFDALRGISALIVLAGHVIQIYGLAWGAESEIMARHAVLVFFLLSGYLITASIQHNIRSNGQFRLTDYAASRIARIYPPLIGAIVLTVIAVTVVRALGLEAGRLTISTKDVLLALAMQNGMLQANGPLWSLYMEFHIYALAALIMCRWWPLAIALFAGWAWINPNFVFFSAVWLLGSCFAARRAIVPCCVLVIAASFASSEGWIQPLACIVYASVMFATTWLDRMPLAFTGQFSYSLYVTHFPVLLLAHALNIAAAIAGISAVALAYVFSLGFENQRRFRPIARRLLTAVPGLR